MGCMDDKNVGRAMTIEGLLTFGQNIKLNGLELINYKLKDIYDPEVLGLVNYYGLIGICTEKPENIFRSYALVRQLVDFLNLFTNVKWEYAEESNVVVEASRCEICIGEDNAEDILGLYRKMYCLDDELAKRESDRDDIDDEMKALLLAFEEEQSKVDKAIGADVNLTSIIEGVSCKHPSINMLNVGEYTIYQLYRTYRRMCKIEHEDRTLTGYYTGHIQLSNMELKSLNWASKNK